VLFIRRVNCINTTSGICQSVYVGDRVAEVVLIQLTLLMMSTWLLETCKELE